MSQPRDIKVVLQNSEGKYLGGSAINWRFTEDRSKATVFDFFGHRVDELVALFREKLGFNLQPVPLPPEEVYETCDICQRLLMPRQVFFDGSHFLCADCNAQADARPQPKELAA